MIRTKIDTFIEWLDQQLGAIYVWGAQGEYATVALITKMEVDASNRERALKLYNTRSHNGKYKVKMYDCSGLVVRFLLDNKIISSDTTAAGLYGKCDHIELRRDLKKGDLVFRHDGSKIHHVGVYIGKDMVIHAKGRDYGVIKEHITLNGEHYWNKYGRLSALNDNVLPDPYMAAYAGETFVRLRSKPDITGEIIGQVSKGEKVIVLDIDKNGWADVIKKDNGGSYTRGYCVSTYLKKI